MSQKHDFAKETIRRTMDTRSIKMMEIDLSSDRYTDGFKVDAKTTSYGMNRLTRRFYAEAPDMVKMYDKGCIRLVNNKMENSPYTTRMILVDTKGLDADSAANFAEMAQQHFISVKFCDNGEAYLLYRSMTEKLTLYFAVSIGLIDDASVVISTEDRHDPDLQAVLKAAGEVRSYGCVYAGPSNQRQQTYILFQVEKGESRDAFMARMKADLDMVSGGLLSSLEEMVAVRGSMSREKLFKLNSRLSLAFTPMTESMEMHSFAYFNGAFGSGFADGQWLLNGDMLAEHYALEAESVYGIALQARVIDGVIGKGMAIATSRENIAIFVAQHKTEVVSYDEFRAAYLTDTLEKGVLYCVGAALPDCVFDKNTMKVVTMKADAYHLQILSVRDNTSGHLNIQDATGIMHLEGAAEFIMNLGKTHVDAGLEKIDRIIAGEVQDRIVNPDGYYPQLISDLAPSYVAHDKNLYKSVVEQVVRGLVGDIDAFNFDIEGDEYRYLQSDYAGMVDGHGILKEGEVYAPGKKDGIVNLTRCPKADRFENFMAQVVSLDEVLARIDASCMRDDVKKVVREMYIYADDALIVTPDDDRLANSLGGSDFDGDGATCHFNPKYVAIQSKEMRGSNTIPKAAPSGKKVTHFDIDVAADMFISGLYGQKGEHGKRIAPTGIGIIANHATLVSALVLASDEKLEMVLDTVVRPAVSALGVKNDGHKYVRRFEAADVEISDADVVDATNDFYASDMNVESFRNILKDAQRMGASVEGRTIDQNKTGEDVHSGYLGVLENKDLEGNNIKRRNALRCKAHDVQSIAVRFERDGEGNETAKIRVNESKSDKVMVIESPISKVRIQLAAYLEKKCNEYLAREIEASVVDEQLVNNGLGAGKVNLNDLRMAGMINSEVSGNDALVSKEKAIILEDLANTVRRMFAAGTRDSQKYAQVKKMAKKGDGTYSSFEYVLREEFVQGVLYVAETEGWSTNQVVGYPAFVKNDKMVSDEEVLHFTNGRTSAGEGVLTDAKVNGNWKLQKVGHKFFVVMNAKEYFRAPEITKNVVLLLKNYDAAKNVSSSNHDTDVNDLKGSKLFFSVGNGIIATPEGSNTTWNFFTPWNGKFHAFAKNHGCIEVGHVIKVASKKNVKGSTSTFVCGRIVDAPAPELDMSSDIELGAPINF